MRFAVARQEGLSEDTAALIDDHAHADALTPGQRAALAYTDVMLAGGTPEAALVDDLRHHHSDGQLVEMTLGISLFHGFSKMLIVLGLEPEEMDTTVVPTPDVRR